MLIFFRYHTSDYKGLIDAVTSLIFVVIEVYGFMLVVHFLFRGCTFAYWLVAFLIELPAELFRNHDICIFLNV